MDFETIRRGDDSAGEKYLAFSEIQLWHWQTNIRGTHSRLGLAAARSDLDKQDWVEHVRTLLEKHYGFGLDEIGKVRTWDQRALFERAQALGPDYEVHYRELYSHQSWSAHSGAAGVAGMTLRYLELRALECLWVAFDIASRMTASLISEFDWQGEELPVVERIIANLHGTGRAGGDDGQSTA